MVHYKLRLLFDPSLSTKLTPGFLVLILSEILFNSTLFCKTLASCRLFLITIFTRYIFVYALDESFIFSLIIRTSPFNAVE